MVLSQQDRETAANEKQRPTFPLSVALEGQCWVLTALVESTVAIWIFLLQTEKSGKYQKDLFFRNQWTEEIFNYVFFMVAGAFSAGVAIGVLSLNLRPPTIEDWRYRSLRSFFALIVLDIIALDHVAYLVIYMGIDITEQARDDPLKLGAMTFITVVGVLCTIAFNIRFLQHYGLCAFCRSKKFGEKLVQQTQDWFKIKSKNSLPVAEVENPVLHEPPTETQEDTKVDNPVLQASPAAVPKEVVTENHVPQRSLTEVPEEGLDRSSTNEQLSSERCFQIWRSLAEVPSSSSSNSEANESNESKPASQVLERWDTKHLIEIGSQKLSQRKAIPSVPSQTREISSVHEDSQKVTTTKRGIRRLPNAPDVSKIVQKILIGDFVSPKKFKSYFTVAALRDLWDSVKEDSSRFGYAVWIKTAFFTSVVVLIYTCMQSLSIIHSLVNEYEDNRQRIAQHMQRLDQYMRDVGWINGVDSVARQTTVKFLLLFDQVILDSRWTALAGYPLGTLFGFYGLVAVLIQHKRMSLAVSDSLSLFNAVAGTEHLTNSPWLEFRKKYPILDACFFLAILSSTAVLQSQITGSILSISFGMLVNPANLQFLFELFGFYVLAYIVVFIIDVIVMRFLRSSLITDDGFGIRHPRWFNFFMVVLSMVHLVIGLLYALWRMLYLFVTTVFVLNRLDVCLFTAGKRFDNGHQAFMSMLVLTVLIQQDTERHSTTFKLDSKTQTV